MHGQDDERPEYFQNVKASFVKFEFILYSLWRLWHFTKYV